MTAPQQNIDTPAIILSDEQIALIVERVLDALRPGAMKWREAKLAELRALEDMHDCPRSIPTHAERTGRTKPDRGHHNR